MTTTIAFLLSSVLIIGFIGFVIYNSLSDIKILESGSTLEKMELLGVGVSTTLNRQYMAKLTKRNKYGYLVSITIAVLLILGVVFLTIYRIFGSSLGI